MSSIEELLADDAKLTEVTKAVFEAVDTDGSGAIDRRELKIAMESVAREAGIAAPSEADINEMLSGLDADHSGTIDVHEFKVLIVEVLKALQ
jgi:Ca2+-binding EF-hand superfamily protein